MKRYHGMCKYQQIIFFLNVVKDIRPTYSNKEELAPLIVKLNPLNIYAFFLKIFCGNKSPFCGATAALCFGLQLTLAVGFKAIITCAVLSLACNDSQSQL